MHVNTNQHFSRFHVGSGRVVSTDGEFHASAWPSEVDDALDAVDGTSMIARVLEDVWVSDAADGGAKDGVFQADVALPGACTGGSCHDDLPALTVDRGPIAACGFSPCLWTMANPPEVEMPELCLIHCWMMISPILMGYAADRRRLPLRGLGCRCERLGVLRGNAC